MTSQCCSWRRCGWVATCCDWVVVFNRCCRISSLLGGKLNSDEYLHDIHDFWLTWVNVGMTSPSVSCHKTSNVRLRYPTPSWLPGREVSHPVHHAGAGSGGLPPGLIRSNMVMGQNVPLNRWWMDVYSPKDGNNRFWRILISKVASQEFGSRYVLEHPVLHQKCDGVHRFVGDLFGWNIYIGYSCIVGYMFFNRRI